jgi:hypothetical protein
MTWLLLGKPKNFLSASAFSLYYRLFMEVDFHDPFYMVELTVRLLRVY